MKIGEKPFDLRLKNGTTIHACFACQVESILVEHECKTIVPRQFDVVTEDFTFVTKIYEGIASLDNEMFVSMKGTQFPIISNSCTTGHKLQGCSVDDILVNSWFYGSNWTHVVLSRVRTSKGLHLRKPLSNDLTKYEPDEDMLDMLKCFEDNCPIKMLNEKRYKQLEDIQ